MLTCLSTSGSRYSALTQDQQRIARELADGLGPLHPVEHAPLVWDWQHVSDSTPGGFRRIHEYLRVEGLLP